MPGQYLQAVDGLGAKPCAEALDELRGFRARAAAIFARLPNRVGRKHAQHERVRTQLTTAHGLGQCERVQSLPEKLRETPSI